MNKRVFPPLWVALCGSVFASFSSIYVKLAVGVSPAVIGFYRMFVGMLVMLCICLARREKLNLWAPGSGYALAAGIAFAADLAMWHQGIKFIGPSLATFLVNMQIFVVMVVGILFYKERVTLRGLAALAIAVPGLILLVGQKWDGTIDHYEYGIVLSLAAAVAFAFYLLFLHKLQQNTDTRKSNAAMIVWLSFYSSIALAVISLLEGAPLIPDVSPKIYMWLVLNGVFTQGLGYWLIARAMSGLNVVTASFTLLLQPILTFVWEVLLFGRVTPLGQWIGGMLILVAIYLAATRFGKRTYDKAGSNHI